MPPISRTRNGGGKPRVQDYHRYLPGKRITVVSTGIGCDNIDIVMNELDALANIDFETRRKPHPRSLELAVAYRHLRRLATLTSGRHIRRMSCPSPLVRWAAQLLCRTQLRVRPAHGACLPQPYGMVRQHVPLALYVIDASTELIDRIAQNDMVRGVTITAGGFFGLKDASYACRLPTHQNEKIENLNTTATVLPTSEMESSALAGLSRLIKCWGYKAMTVCMVIANA